MKLSHTFCKAGKFDQLFDFKRLFAAHFFGILLQATCFRALRRLTALLPTTLSTAMVDGGEPELSHAERRIESRPASGP